jgi:Fic family protein
LFVLDAAEKKIVVDTKFLCDISALVMKNTGSIYNTVLGSFDTSRGELRLINNYAGETRFPDFKKVPDLLKKLCEEINSTLENISKPADILSTAYDAHFNFVSIHPFADGNGRVSRLLMNYLQHRYNQPLTIVHKEDRAEYFKALVDSRKEEDIQIFRKFMFEQHKKHLKSEISKVISSKKKVDDILNPKKGKKDDNGSGMSIMFV